MASSKQHSKDPVSAEKQWKGCAHNGYKMAGARKGVSSLLDLTEAVIEKYPERFMPLLFAIPYITIDRHQDSHEPLSRALTRDLLRYFRSVAQAPQDWLGTALSPDASVEDRRRLAEITQELHEGNEDFREVERRLSNVLATVNALQNILQNLNSRLTERVQRRGAGLRADAPPAAPRHPRQREVPSVPRPSVASGRPSIVSFRDELYEAGRQTIETRAYRGRLHRLADDIEKTLTSIQRSSGAISLPGRPAESPCSQSWMPQNLAMAVSRVYYYSSDYAEELISSPLKVSGYTVRLAVLCLAADSCVKLLFRAQFCFDSTNDEVEWPFRGAVRLVIHHPTNRASNRVYTVHPSQDIETLMPRNVHNAFFYLAGPISALRLDQSGFWAMQTLHLSVKVVPSPDCTADSYRAVCCDATSPNRPSHSPCE